MTAARDELGALCRDLAELRTLAAECGRSAELDTLVADLVSGADVGDRRIELMRQLGIPAGPGRDLAARLPGLAGGRPAAEVYECPAGRCTRRWVRPPGDPVPTCAVSGARLRPGPYRP